jgi:FG-GAP-like repeat
VAIGDVNGDGKLDIVTANTSVAAGISVLLNVADGSFQARRDFGADLSAVDLAIGDLNGDGSPDPAVGGVTVDGFPEQVLSVFLNAGDGSFPTRRDYTTSFDPRSIEIGDVNGDSKPDQPTALSTCAKRTKRRCPREPVLYA